MTGAMAGSTALNFNQLSPQLKVITLTINNRCNLNCPHCYLQYAAHDGLPQKSIIDFLTESKAEHVAIVGKEPLVDRESIQFTEDLVFQLTSREKTVSLVTNGLLLNRLSTDSIERLAWIDVSLDGGPETYQRYRRGSFDRLVRNVDYTRSSGAKQIVALHTISVTNIAYINDMMQIEEYADWDAKIFSPYVEVRNHGDNPTSQMKCAEFLAAMSKSGSFMNDSSALVLLSGDAFGTQGLSTADLRFELFKAGLAEKSKIVETDPLQLGYIRLTYDGLVMTPYQSLHPAIYDSVATRLNDYESIDSAFETLLAA